MKYNPDVLQKVLTEYLEASQRLKELASLSFNEWSGDPHKIASTKYHLILVIESAIDICNHVIAKNNFRVPEDYGDTFKVMAENDIISEAFSSNLTNMARFGNRLVHRYWDINTEKIYDILQHNLDDLDHFLNELRSSLKYL